MECHGSSHIAAGDSSHTIAPCGSHVSDIQRLIGRRYGVSRIDIISDRRTAGAVLPRHVAMWLARHVTTLSLPTIGRLFGDRHHTTVLHAVRRIDARMAADPQFDAELRALRFALMPAERQG